MIDDRAKHFRGMTICVDCKHCGFASVHGMPIGDPVCMLSRANYVYNGALGFNPCSQVNTDGNCAKFVPREAVLPPEGLLKRICKAFRKKLP